MSEANEETGGATVNKSMTPPRRRFAASTLPAARGGISHFIPQSFTCGSE
jgi:hypothetical protein